MCRATVIAVVIAAVGCRAPGTPPRANALREADVLISLNLEGYLEPCGCSRFMPGGLARIAQLARSNDAPRAWIDLGQSLFASPQLLAERRAQDELKAQAMARIYTRAGLKSFRPQGLDRAAGEPFLASLGLPVSETPAVDVGGIAVSFTWPGLPPTDARVRGLLWPEGRETLLPYLARSDVARPELVVVLRAAERSRVTELGGLPVVELESKGRSVLRLRIQDDGRYRPSWDAASATALRNLEALEARITLLVADVNAPGLDAEVVRLREEKLAQLTARRDALRAATGAARSSTSRLWVDVVRVDPAIPEAPWARAEIARYDDEAGQLNLAHARSHPQPCPTGDAGYVGSARCAECHTRATAQWEGTRHARAFTSLEARRKQHHLDCVGCHVTGWQRTGGPCQVGVAPEWHGVGCESCHGPGGAHVARPSAKNIQRAASPETCTGCHDPENSPHFSFERFLPQVLGEGHGSPGLR